MVMGSRVVIDVRIPEGSWGGVQQAAIGLIHGLSGLASGTDVFHLIAYKGESSWLRPFLDESLKLNEVHPPTTPTGRMANRLRRIDRVRLGRLLGSGPPGGLYQTMEELRPDVVHFTHPNAFPTSARIIYQPHDLQHLHFPEFFSLRERRRRTGLYRSNCRMADMVAVMSRWGRADIVKQFGIRDSNVFVIPLSAPTEAYARVTESDEAMVRQKYALPEAYVFYPAQTWPHKNHIRLLRGLAEAYRSGLSDVNLVCTGHLTDEFVSIQREARRIDISDRVRFLGWIPANDVRAMYRSARAVIFPSLFEGWGMPVTEASFLGVPVACSRIPVLVEQAGDTALFFDPRDCRQIADAIASLWTNDELRFRLATTARVRTARLTWTTIAETYRAHYRRLAGEPLSAGDEALVERSRTGLWLPENKSSQDPS
jgi:glycosyltransferase involved in cell wall biosynthesis